jgi:hypothetical protein
METAMEAGVDRRIESGVEGFIQRSYLNDLDPGFRRGDGGKTWTSAFAGETTGTFDYETL